MQFVKVSTRWQQIPLVSKEALHQYRPKKGIYAKNILADT